VSSRRAQSHEVQLPFNFTCNDCTLQILRQADDLSSSALFFSCADIDIVPADHYEETCFNRGSYVNAQCECEKNFYGDRCQYADDCSDDQDCGPNGKCIDHGGSSMPHKQCYCQSGWFGERCERESPIKTTKFYPDDYRVLQVLPDYRLHWRILQDTDEIEVVAQVNGTTWVGVGWRPLDISPLCQLVPHNYKYGKAK
jgi:EGF-like domain